jgi:hypothetical protein
MKLYKVRSKFCEMSLWETYAASADHAVDKYIALCTGLEVQMTRRSLKGLYAVEVTK